ncbi:TatD family hydrolase [Georgenia sp. Z1344]|uniref:TatD family hydrolase n=1 Tax=Georgenia sp. Z1344 TaxID=3416706 RepID=UPI003CEC4DDE
MSGENGKKKERGFPPAGDPLPAGVVDNHTHLPLLAADGSPLDPDDAGLPGGADPLTTDDQLARAAEVGVLGLLSVACDVPSLAGTVALAHEHAAIAAAVAIHPNESALHARAFDVAPDGLEPDVRDHHELTPAQAFDRVAELATDDRVVAVGETGLDFYRTAAGRGHDAQVAAFRDHLALARELGKPVQIHDREAHEEVAEILLRDGAPERTVFHCFSGDERLARQCAENGWYVSVAGPVTFRSNDALREAISLVPLGQLLVETDSPYLTPVPFRGRPNASYVLPRTVRALAELRGLDLAELCERLTATTREVYGGFWGSVA